MNNASLELGGDNWAAKDGNLLGYAVGDSSGKYVPNEFTFTRGSNLSATRINEQGYIEKGYENTLLGSNNWAQSTSAYEITGGEAGYDGTNDAWLVDKLAPGYFGKGNVSVSDVSTISLYAKAGTLDRIFVFYSGEAARFDLTNATASKAGGTTIAQSIELVSGTTDWYRCSMVIDKTITTSLLIKPQNSSNQDVAGTIYIQDAMVNQGLVAYPYIETTAASVEAGVLENEPRIDYSSGTASLLLEPQRTNLVPQSEYFGGYSNANSTDEPNAATSPEGLTNATSFLEAATTGQHKLFTSLTFDGSSTYTFSIFAKSNGRDLYVDTQNSNEWGGRAWFDLTAGTANAVLGTADIEDFGNGWYRCIVTGASTLAGGNFIELLTSNGSANSTTGDITKGVYIYGAQLELGSYPTSYIPTYGVSQTREDDFGNNNNILAKPVAFGANDDFTFYYEGSFDKDGNNGMIFGGGNAGNGDDYRNYWWLTATGMLLKGNSETSMASAIFNQAKNTNYKLLVKRDGSRIDFFINGTKISTNQASTNTAFTLRSVGWSYSNTVYQVSGNIKQFKALPTALTDSECIELTTI